MRHDGAAAAQHAYRADTPRCTVIRAPRYVEREADVPFAAHAMRGMRVRYASRRERVTLWRKREMSVYAMRALSAQRVVEVMRFTRYYVLRYAYRAIAVKTRCCAQRCRYYFLITINDRTEDCFIWRRYTLRTA